MSHQFCHHNILQMVLTWIILLCILVYVDSQVTVPSNETCIPVPIAKHQLVIVQSARSSVIRVQSYDCVTNKVTNMMMIISFSSSTKVAI
jgi:hypothetical protein